MTKKKFFDINNKEIEFSEFESIKPVINEIMNAKRSGTYNSNYGAKTKNVIVTFDTETTNAKDNGVKKPFIYSYCLTVMGTDLYGYGTGNLYAKAVSIHCNTLEQFKQIVRYLCKTAGCRVSHDLTNNKQVENGTEDHNNYDSSDDVYLNFYVHNLPFDYSFLMDAFPLRTLFCSAAHKPYYALTWDGAKFIDTVVLTQKTLEELGNSIEYFKVKKQVGDLDYDKVRTSDTTFTKKEMGYIYGDTLTLATYIWELVNSDYNGRLCDIPLTQTGKVRRFVRDLCFAKPKSVVNMINNGFTFGTSTETLKDKENSKKFVSNIDGMMYYRQTRDPNVINEDHIKAINNFNDYCKRKKEAYKRYIKLLKINTPNDYLQMKETYSGGFTHASPLHLGRVMRDVKSRDFTSSYPTVMVAEEFPSGMYTREKYTVDDMLKRLDSKKKDHRAYMFKISFSHIHNKLSDNEHCDDYLSESKVFDQETHRALIDLPDALYYSFNGRVSDAYNGYFYATDVDWEVLSKVYDIDGLSFSNIMEFNTAPLPQEIVMSVLYFYREKTKLKHVKGKERDYLRSKEMLNAIYGMMVQDPIHSVITYKNDGSWDSERMLDKHSITEALDDYNSSKSRFLWYPWGIYVAAYARRNLWEGILACGKDYIYSDTDSIKILHEDKHMNFINDYNSKIVNKIHKICDYYQIPYEFTCPKDVDGNEHQLGIWDADGSYSYFKTLGAKRYVDIDKDSHELEITISGLSKAAGRKWLLKKSKVKHDGSKVLEDPQPIFDLFNDEMEVPVGQAGKLTHTYVNKYKGFDITDYQGHTTHINDGQGCFLEPAGFTLSISNRLVDALLAFQDGYRLVESTQVGGIK